MLLLTFSCNRPSNFSKFRLYFTLMGVGHKIFYLHFFYFSTPWRSLINRLIYFRILTPRCAWHRGVKILFLVNLIFLLQIFSSMIYVFIPKRISPDCPFKSNQRLTKILILTPSCSLTLQCDAHRGAWLFTMIHSAELDSSVWSTPRSLTLRYDPLRGAWLQGGITPFSVISHLLHLSTTFYWKTLEVKKIPRTVCVINFISVSLAITEK